MGGDESVAAQAAGGERETAHTSAAVTGTLGSEGYSMCPSRATRCTLTTMCESILAEPQATPVCAPPNIHL